MNSKNGILTVAMILLVALSIAVILDLSAADESQRDGSNEIVFSDNELKYSVNKDGITVTLMGPSDDRRSYRELILYETASYQGRTYIVTAIAEDAFYESKFDGNLEIPYTVKSIGESAFEHCVWLKGTLTVNGGSIGPDAFKDSGFTKLILNEGVTSIADGAFLGCKGITRELAIPSTVTSIGDKSFSGCTNLQRITVSTSTSNVQANAFEGSTLRLLRIDVANISKAFADALKPTLEGVEFTEKVVTIGDSMFKDFELIRPLNIPGNVKKIDKCAFKDCDELPSLVLGEGIVTIDASAFNGCTGLEGDLTIPSTVKEIGGNAFENAGFRGTLTIKSGAIDGGAFKYCRFTKLILENGVTSIGYYAFEDVRAFSGNLTIPGTVKTIGNFAFKNCGGFTGLVLNEGINSIGNYAFAGCRFMGDLTIPATVKSIGNDAFNGNESLDGTLTVENGTIGDKAFINNGFTELVLGKGVTSIGAHAFDGCKNLKYVKVSTDIRNIPANLFDISPVKELCIDAHNISKEFADALKGTLVKIEFTENVISIADHLFDSFRDLEGTLVIPSSVKKIGEKAFSGCNGFSCLIVEDNVMNISETAFDTWNLRDREGNPVDMQHIAGHIFIKNGEDMNQCDCKVTFDFGTGKYVLTVIMGSEIDRPMNPHRDGYIFKEWQIGGKTVSWPFIADNDVTVTAVWEKIPDLPPESQDALQTAAPYILVAFIALIAGIGATYLFMRTR